MADISSKSLKCRASSKVVSMWSTVGGPSILARISDLFPHCRRLGSLWINRLPYCPPGRDCSDELRTLSLTWPEIFATRVWATRCSRDGRDWNAYWTSPKRTKSVLFREKKRHTLKCQIIANRNTLEIICLSFGKGRRHDFQIFKVSGIHIHPDTESLQDSGYQGISAYHANSYVPLKKPQHGELTSLEREYNRALSQERMGIEHINRSLKIFRILSERYRNRRRRYALRCNLISAIYNHELTLAA